MLVVNLIGRNVGSVIELRHDAAESGISMGTHRKATEEEIADAGFAPENSAAAAPAEAFPEGFSAEPHESGGFQLKAPDGSVRDEPFPNLSAARSFANDVVERLAAEAKSAADAEAQRLAEEQAAAEAGNDPNSKKKK